jgi:hypothetical protein
MTRCLDDGFMMQENWPVGSSLMGAAVLGIAA